MNYLFLIFVVTPILELWVLIQVGGVIGVLPTVGLVVLTAMVGIALLRHQGFSTLFRAQQKMSEGQIPAQEMVEGIILAIGGALLLTPGFVTDAIGFSCLLPGTRHVFIAWGMKRFKGNIHVRAGASAGSRKNEAGVSGDVIEGEFKRDEKDR